MRNALGWHFPRMLEREKLLEVYMMIARLTMLTKAAKK